MFGLIHFISTDGSLICSSVSQHYGGITKTWSDGTIYCSLPTANLVHQQLGVEMKYLHVSFCTHEMNASCCLELISSHQVSQILLNSQFQ